VTGTVVVCRTCRRPLRDAISRACQRGPVCRAREGILVVRLGQPDTPVRAVRDPRPGLIPGQLELALGTAS